MASIMDKLKKNSRIKETSVLASSKFFSEQDQCPTNVPMVNVALSGRIDGGLSSGLTVLAGPSKHFKTSFALLMASAYLKQHSDAIMLFYDSEFGSPQSYFESFNIDTNRVLHTPITDVEKSRFVKEKSRIPISVSWEGGIEEYSGLTDIALLSGHVTKPSQGWYCRVDTETGEEIQPKVREKDTLTAEFWEPILSDPKFQEFVRSHYMIGHKSLIDAEELPEDLRPSEEE